MNYSFPRYLAAKKTVDDRALNHFVWETLISTLHSGPLRILEIGAGIGTMIERLLDRGLLRQAHYMALDAQPENIAVANERLRSRGFITTPNGLELGESCVFLVTADLFEFLLQAYQPWDLLIAHAFLDLVDIPSTLPRLLKLMKPGGLGYFTVNFDGGTFFEPAVDPELEDSIQNLYHQTMDTRQVDGRPSGDSHSGRHLFTHLRAAGAQILAAGASDWVVFPGHQGYPGDEAYFLHFIINTIDLALHSQPSLDAAQFQHWVAARHAQIERKELVYITHQLDFLVKQAE